jgi:predicted metalloprotease with PDZ domain
LRGEALIALLPPPQPAGATQWAAETRGRTVTLISGQSSSKLAALAQLDGALSHELFHLWVPNALRLTGDYAWFYEGFTNYQALLVGMRRGQLSFRDYLNALGRAFDAYRGARGATEVPLIATSESRWKGNPTLVYHKGLLIAFLSDLTLGLGSGGRQSLSDVYRDLLRRHAAPAVPMAADDALTAALRRMTSNTSFVDRYILSANPLVLQNELTPFGLRIEPGGVRTHIAVAHPLTREQRELLKKFGYNEKLEAGPRPPDQRPRERPRGDKQD